MTNAWLKDHADTTAEVFLDAGMADEALYLAAGGGEAVPCRVMVDRDLQAVGFDTRAATPMTVVRALVAEVGTPRRGAVFVLDGVSYRVDAQLDSDEGTVALQVVESST